MSGNLSHRLCSGLLPIYCRKEFQLRFLNFELKFCFFVFSVQTFGTAYPYNRFYVCNYGPTGNWINLPVYLQGTAGSACPPGTVNTNGLCAWTQFVTLRLVSQSVSWRSVLAIIFSIFCQSKKSNLISQQQDFKVLLKINNNQYFCTSHASQKSSEHWADSLNTHTSVTLYHKCGKGCWAHQTWWLEIKAMANSSVSGTWLYDPTKHIWQTQVQVLFFSFFSVVFSCWIVQNEDKYV